MSLDLVNDGQRYSIAISDYFHEMSYVVYVATILDQCFNYEYKLFFRYKSLKNIHEKLTKIDIIKHHVPEFPKTRSFLFVNRTNSNSRNIQDRARELEYYISKLLNNKQLSNIKQIKSIITKAKDSFSYRKSKSEHKIQTSKHRTTSSLSKFYNKSSTIPLKTLNIKYL